MEYRTRPIERTPVITPVMDDRGRFGDDRQNIFACQQNAHSAVSGLQPDLPRAKQLTLPLDIARGWAALGRVPIGKTTGDKHKEASYYPVGY